MRQSALLLTLPLSTLVACGGDSAPSPSEVRSRISDDLGHVLRESSAAGERGSAALQAQTALGFISRFSGTTEGAVLGKRLTSIDPGLLANRLQLTTGSASEQPNPDELIDLLNTKIFTDENHLGDGIYKIPGSLVCEDAGVVDPECVQQFDKLEARLRVADDDGTLTIALQLDANHDEPLRLALTHDSLALTVDLDETSQAVATLAPVFGEGAPNASLAGQATGTIEVLGPQSATFSFAIDRAIDIKFADAGIALDSAGAFRFTSAAANVASLSFDGVAGTGSLVVDVGATTAHVPSLEDGGNAIDFDLPGASVVAMLAAGQPAQLTHIGLGDRTTTLSVGGQRAIAIDLNPDDGRALSATLSHDATTGTDTISVSPKFDLRTAVDHAVLGDSAPVYDVTQVLLTGSLRGGASDQIEVVSGSFGIATNPPPYGFSASAGQCVTATTAEDVATGQFYEQFAVGACN